MKKLLLLIILFLIPCVYSSSYLDYLTIAKADTLYCQLNGDCFISNLTVNQLTVIQNATIVNYTFVNYNSTGLFSGDNLYLDGWMNSSSATIRNSLTVGEQITENGTALLNKYLAIDGSNANQNIDIGSYDFSASTLYGGNVELFGNTITTADSNPLYINGVKTRITSDDGMSIGVNNNFDFSVDIYDAYIKQLTADKDVYITYNDGGVTKTALFIDGSEGLLSLGNGGKLKINDDGTVSVINDLDVNGNQTLYGYIDNPTGKYVFGKDNTVDTELTFQGKTNSDTSARVNWYESGNVSGVYARYNGTEDVLYWGGRDFDGIDRDGMSIKRDNGWVKFIQSVYAPLYIYGDGEEGKLMLSRSTNNNINSSGLYLVEANTDWGVNAVGFRVGLDGSTNQFKIQSGSSATITDRFTIARDTGVTTLAGSTVTSGYEVNINGDLSLTGSGGDIEGVKTLIAESSSDLNTRLQTSGTDYSLIYQTYNGTSYVNRLKIPTTSGGTFANIEMNDSNLLIEGDLSARNYTSSGEIKLTKTEKNGIVPITVDMADLGGYLIGAGIDRSSTIGSMLKNPTQTNSSYKDQDSPCYCMESQYWHSTNENRASQWCICNIAQYAGNRGDLYFFYRHSNTSTWQRHSLRLAGDGGASILADGIQEVNYGGLQFINSFSSTSSYDQFSPGFLYWGSAYANVAGASRSFKLAHAVQPEQSANGTGVFKFYYAGANQPTPLLNQELMRMEWGDRVGMVYNNHSIDNYEYKIMGENKTKVSFNTSTDNFEIRVNLNVTGNITGNELYAGMYLYNETGYSFSIPASNIYYNITNNFISELNNGFIFDPTTDKLTALLSGIYKVDWHMSFSGGNNNQYGIVAVKNYNISASRKCYSQRGTSAVLIGSVSGVCLYHLEAGDTISMQIDDEASPSADVTIYQANLVITRVGN